MIGTKINLNVDAKNKIKKKELQEKIKLEIGKNRDTKKTQRKKPTSWEKNEESRRKKTIEGKKVNFNI